MTGPPGWAVWLFAAGAVLFLVVLWRAPRRVPLPSILRVGLTVYIMLSVPLLLFRLDTWKDWTVLWLGLALGVLTVGHTCWSWWRRRGEP